MLVYLLCTCVNGLSLLWISSEEDRVSITVTSVVGASIIIIARAEEIHFLPNQVESQPVHEHGLCCGNGHGQVHAQLILGSSDQNALCGRLGQDLQPQRSDLQRAHGQTLMNTQER